MVLSRHAREKMADRGVSEVEVVETVRDGETVPAKRGRQAYRKNFRYDDLWDGRFYAIKQVSAIVADEFDSLVVVTVYAFYF